MQPTPSAVELWKRFHWAFFVNTQGLYIALSRFEQFLADGEIEAARAELVSAAVLMRASGAAMELAGSFAAQDYQSEVRPSMMPPKIEALGFSGLMSWDHASLIQLWKRLGPSFASIPDSLEKEYQEFLQAYARLADSHSAVCSRFGGDRSGSIRNDTTHAVASLDRFKKHRQAMLDPTGRGDPPHGFPRKP